MLKKLEEISKRYKFLSEKLSDPAVIADMGTWQKYSKEQSDLTATVEKYEQYLQTEREMTDAFALAETETDGETHALEEREALAVAESEVPAVEETCNE